MPRLQPENYGTDTSGNAGTMKTVSLPGCTGTSTVFCLFPFVYLLSLPIAHLRGAPRRRLVGTLESARIQVETTESSAWFFNVVGVYSTVTRGPRFKVSSERQLVFVRLTSLGIELRTSSFQVERSIQVSYA